ncbi:MAG: hypothetical protein M1480_10300 [Bacteroidetes bacterium]|nr:hypothetical protein [Bacteroidota bacterium]
MYVGIYAMTYRTTSLYSIVFIIIISAYNISFCQLNYTRKEEHHKYECIKSAHIKSVTKVYYDFSKDSLNNNGETLLYNEFDTTERCIRWIRYWPDGAKVEEVNKYKYDDYGRINEIITEGIGGSIDTRTKNIYDSAGNLIETDKYDIGGSLLTMWKHKYDDKDREVEQVLTKGVRFLSSKENL